jgi:hypothetical protein
MHLYFVWEGGLFHDPLERYFTKKQPCSHLTQGILFVIRIIPSLSGGEPVPSEVSGG